MNKGLLTLAVAVATLTVASSYAADTMMKDDKMMVKDTMMMSGSTTSGTMMSGDKMMVKDTMMKDDKMMAKHGEVVNYSKGIITKYANAGKTVVILFDASRCPTCVALNADINTNLTSIPENVVIIKADFDTTTSLKKLYKVTTQNTVVIIKKSGKKYKILAKKSGGFDTLAKVKALIK